MRIFITGGTGFVGAHLVEALLAAGHDLACLKRASSRPWRLDDVQDAQKIQFIEGDMEDVAAFGPAFAAFAPEAVIHLAWQGITAADRSHPGQFNNIAQSLALLRLCVAARVQHFIGLGSQAEYGPCDQSIDERHPAWPTSPYGLAKLSVCQIARDICAQAGIRFAWLRLFSAYGPKDGPDWLIPYVSLALARGQRPALSPCAHSWDYIHVRDAAAGIKSVLDHEQADGIFNLGSGTAHILAAMIKTVRDAIAPEIEPEFGAIPYKPGQVMNLRADIGRLQSATGFACVVPLEKGLRETALWYRDHISLYPQG